MIATMVYKLTKDLAVEQIEAAGLGAHYVNHDKVFNDLKTSKAPLKLFMAGLF